MNVHELLRLLQAEHDGTAARLAELAAIRKVIDGLTPPDHEPAPAQPTATVYQRIVTTLQ